MPGRATGFGPEQVRGGGSFVDAETSPSAVAASSVSKCRCLADRVRINQPGLTRPEAAIAGPGATIQPGKDVGEIVMDRVRRPGGYPSPFGLIDGLFFRTGRVSPIPHARELAPRANVTQQRERTAGWRRYVRGQSALDGETSNAALISEHRRDKSVPRAEPEFVRKPYVSHLRTRESSR